MTELHLVLAWGVLTAAVAFWRGLNPIIWFFVGGYVGLFLLAILPSGRALHASDLRRIAMLEADPTRDLDAEARHHARTGNRVGLVAAVVFWGIGLALRFW